VNNLLRLIREHLLNGGADEVKLRGFGTFRKRIVSYNIAPPGKEAKQGQTATVSFKAGKHLKKRI
jgi:nucleoid DNA-binding protein